MLRCSDAQARQRDDHKKVAYFASKGAFWSPTYGEINSSGTVTTLTSSRERTQPLGSQTQKRQGSQQKKVTQKVSATTTKSQTTKVRNCPVCNCPLELYEYTKGSEKKQMLRCSDAQARRQEDHKDAVFFASRGQFWSATYGEIK